jgi:hypothetical protein
MQTVFFQRRRNPMNVTDLVVYFTSGVASRTLETVGAEVETQFVTKDGEPISVAMSQQMLVSLAEIGWAVTGKKSGLITALVDTDGNQIFYELGRHNIEVATIPVHHDTVVETVRRCLEQVYHVGDTIGAKPYVAPVLYSDEDLLVIPDERDAVWLELDGREALAPLARTSSVQFTISVSPKDAVLMLNCLGARVDEFLEDFPQDAVWKRYIAESKAGYLPNRYGGPVYFQSLEDYCDQLVQHDVVSGTRLTPFHRAREVDFSLYIRSVWWYFRLKRYGSALCVEIRPLARREDGMLQEQLERVLGHLSF